MFTGQSATKRKRISRGASTAPSMGDGFCTETLFFGRRRRNDFDDDDDDARYYWHVPKDISEETAALLPRLTCSGTMVVVVVKNTAR